MTAERAAVQALFNSGADGFVLADPGYAADAGYELGFRQAWATRLGTPWLDPGTTVNTRYQAARLMAQLTVERVKTLLEVGAFGRPGAARLVSIGSPLQSLLSRTVTPTWQIVVQPSVQEVIGQVSPETLLTPARSNGARRLLPFDQAYLGYSALFGTLRDLNKRLWFAIDPPAPQHGESFEQARARYEQQVSAALLFGEVSAYQAPALPGPAQTFNSDQLAEMANVNAALAQMYTQPRNSENGTEDIAILLSDSASGSARRRIQATWTDCMVSRCRFYNVVFRFSLPRLSAWSIPGI